MHEALDGAHALELAAQPEYVFVDLQQLDIDLGEARRWTYIVMAIYSYGPL